LIVVLSIFCLAGCPTSTTEAIAVQDVEVDVETKGNDAPDLPIQTDTPPELSPTDLGPEPAPRTEYCPDGVLAMSFRADWPGALQAVVRTADVADLDKSPMDLGNGAYNTELEIPAGGMLFRYELRGDAFAPDIENQVWWFIDDRFPTAPCTLSLDNGTQVETHCSLVDSTCTGTSASDGISGSATGFNLARPDQAWTALLYRTSDPEPLLISRLQIPAQPDSFDFGAIAHGLYRVILRPTARLYSATPTTDVMDIVEWRSFSHEQMNELPEAKLDYPLWSASPETDSEVSLPIEFTWPEYVEGSSYSVQLYTSGSTGGGTWIWDSGLSTTNSTTFDGTLNQGPRSGDMIDTGALLGWRVHAQTADGWLAWSHLIPIKIPLP
jgi:hypothetical protein